MPCTNQFVAIASAWVPVVVSRRFVRLLIDRFIILAAFTVLMSMATAPAVAAEVYKWRDAQGQLVFSDRAPNGPTERVNVPTAPTPSTAELERLAAQQAAWRHEDAVRKERDLAKASEQAKLDAERAERCRAARSQNARFSYDGNQYRLDPSGRRVYYSVAEIDAKRLEAKKDMTQFCPSVAPP